MSGLRATSISENALTEAAPGLCTDRRRYSLRGVTGMMTSDRMEQNARREVDESERVKQAPSLPHLDDFDRTWFAISTADRAAINSRPSQFSGIALWQLLGAALGGQQRILQCSSAGTLLANWATRKNLPLITLCASVRSASQNSTI